MGDGDRPARGERIDSSSSGTPSTYRLARWLVLRWLGGVYFFAFLALSDQLLPLLGARGLLPVRLFLDDVAGVAGGRAAGFGLLPSLFWVDASDGCLRAACLAGVVLSAAVALGLTNALAMAALWALYTSFVNVGQAFYSFGWEIQLLETGFLAIFLCPLVGWRRLAPVHPAPTLVMLLLRWLIFRIMLGAGLIKMRGDACWRELTCLVWHYETQPIPNPLAWYANAMPLSFHRAGVVFNHFVELVVPWFVFAPRRRLRHAAGGFLLAFQGTLILSGNLAFLNWLTVVPALACFDDALLLRLVPRRWRDRARHAIEAEAPGAGVPSGLAQMRRRLVYALVGLVAFLSLFPVANLLSSRQIMNTSFDRLHLVNTYGAFGSVGKVRHELVLEGTSDGIAWREYGFKCKPGDIHRRPCVISPYHYRIDWLAWFAAFQDPSEHPWLVHLIAQLLEGEPGAITLLATNPFPDAPPKQIRVSLYRYRFTRLGEDAGGAWWIREYVRPYLPPLSLDDRELRRFVAAHRWT